MGLSSSKRNRDNRPMGNLPSSCIEHERTKTGLLTANAAETARFPADPISHNRRTSTSCADDVLLDTDTASNNGNNTATTATATTAASPLRRRKSFMSFLRLNTNGSTKDRRNLHSSSGGSSSSSSRTTGRGSTRNINNKPKQVTVQLPKGTVLLKGCQTAEEHYEVIRKALDGALGLEGDRGLRGMGFEYRLLPCDEHKDNVLNTYQQQQQPSLDQQHHPVNSENPSLYSNPEEQGPDEQQLMLLSSTSERLLAMKKKFDHLQPSDVQSLDGSESESGSYHGRSLDDLESFSQMNRNSGPALACHLCSHRLFHIESCEMVDAQNRKERIADGNMYDRICELAQESAQCIMIREGDLEWVAIDDDKSNTEKPTTPLRVLVSKNGGDHETKSPLFVVCTGRGKVRAGIFTRHHLMCTGLEVATALPLVREAKKRGFRIVVVDPNVHGDSQGFDTFRKTMDFVLSDQRFGGSNANQLVYLCHSASGGHMARHLLEASEETIRNIQAVAFTDSTHSVQWAKKNPVLLDFLQSPKCVYFRSSREQDGVDVNKWYLHAAGEPVQTDTFWVHRFGAIRTLWAGTNEHSLTNWFAHAKIWEHFDSVDALNAHRQ